MAATSSVSGLISGLDTDGIITKLVAYAQKPITILQNEQADYTTKLTSWQDANTRLLALKVKAGAISSPAAFAAKSVSVSDDDALTATATADAAAGSYDITVNRLATAQQIQSQGYADINSATVGTGTLQVGVGTNVKDLTIDSANNTLGGLRDAINRAGAGVTASIIDLGSLTTHDYHLVLNSNSTGEANAITWNPTLAGGTAPSWTTTVEAQDSSITVGSGATATTLTKSSNLITDMVPGLTLSLKEADVSKQVKVSITPDTNAVQSKIEDFVDQYNSVMDFINTQFSFDQDSGTGGTLLGDYTLQTIQQDLRSGIMSVIPGLPSSANTLSQIGFSTDDKDHLVVDSNKLSQALQTNPDTVMKLFAGNGEASDFAVSYLGSTDATKTTGAGSYKVRVDQPATQAWLTAGAAQTSNLTADETLNLNGSSIQLTAGMTPQQVVDKINTFSSATGVTALRTAADGTGTGDYLTLKKTGHGVAGHITVNSTRSNGGGTPASDTTGIGVVQVTEASSAGETGTGTGAAGKDITGAFGVTTNGVTTWEAASGIGQFLTGNAGNANTEGLRAQVNTATAGEHGTITLTQGAASSLDKLLTYLTGKNGSVTSAEDTLNKQISDLKDQITSQTDRLNAYSDKLRAQFAELESNMGQLQSQGNYLASQFAAMNKSK
jgi:flagellar hook-associated protein 2